jgi:hypothetical protein
MIFLGGLKMENEKPFCQLCGKYKENEKLKKVPITPPPPLTEKFDVEMCFDCDKVLFNFNQIITDHIRKKMTEINEANKKLGEKRIIVPGFVPLANLRR